MASLGFIWGPTGGWRCHKHWIKFGDIWCHFLNSGDFYRPHHFLLSLHRTLRRPFIFSCPLTFGLWKTLNKETSFFPVASPVIQQDGVREECAPWFRPQEPVVQPPVPGGLVHQVSASSEGVKPVSMCVWQIQEIQSKVSCVAPWTHC